MNTRLMKIASAVTVPLMALSCSKQIGGQDAFVSFAVSTDDIVAEVTKSNVSDYADMPSPEDFRLLVTDSQGSSVYSGLLKDYDQTTPLKAGAYSVTASYGSSSDEGFGKPYFSGSADFSVAKGESRDVAVRAKLANAIVKLAFTDTFKAYYPDWNFELKTGGGATVSFPKSETRAVFIDAYKFTISGTLTNQGGKTQTFSKAYDKAIDAGKCYTLKFDVSNVGGSSLSVTFDDSVEDVDLADVDLNE